MQNKGFVKVFAFALTLVCLFYLSFSFVTRHHMAKAAEDPKGETHYLDSMQNEKVWLGAYTLKQCREMEIGLGLDLKGGMNVILEVSVPDVVKALADNKTDEAFNKAVAEAAKRAMPQCFGEGNELFGMIFSVGKGGMEMTVGKQHMRHLRVFSSL